MMEYIRIPKGTRVYRCMNENYLTIPYDTSIITSYELLQEVLLIDPMNLNFQNDYVSKLNDIYPGTNYYGLDIFMVSNLKSIYGDKCHGYMTKIKWPSKLHDGREICLFNPLILLKKIDDMSGGVGKIKKNGIIIPKNETWNRICDPRLTPDIWNAMTKKIGPDAFKRLGIIPPHYI